MKPTSSHPPATPTAAPGTLPDEAALARSAIAGVLQPVLDELDEGLIVCDAEGRALVVNFAARGELAAGQALALVEGAVIATRPDQALSLRRALRGAAHGRRQLIELGERGDRLFVIVVPLDSGLLRGRALLVLGRRELCPALSMEMLGNLYALTPTERRVLAGLVAGRRPAAVAQANGVELSTVRTQIGAIRAKLGVDRIDGVTQLAAKLPAAASALRQPAVAGAH